MKTLLSLFDYTGNWSYPYLEAGWNVILIDRKHEIPDDFSVFTKDIAEIDTNWMYENIFDSYETVDGVLAAVPCTDFAVSGAKHWKGKDMEQNTLFGTFSRLETFKQLVYQVLRIVDLCEPDFWALENPVGRMNTVIPEMKEYGPKYFQPYEFGDPYSKKTGLWGKFNMPKPTNIVQPWKGKHGSITQSLGGKSSKTKELRSITPMGFSNAFYQANN